MNDLITHLMHPWTAIEGKGLARTSVVMMVEGVHFGSDGPVFWSANVLRESASKWNKIPVCRNHPRNDDGELVSINDISYRIDGYVDNVVYDSHIKGLKGEIFISLDHEDLWEIQNTTEVSIGCFCPTKPEEGEWNGQYYDKIALSMEPDHLALLPIGQGACSWMDGCGIRVNNLNDNYMEDVFLPRIGTKSKEIDLEAMQKMADENNILLPTVFNRVSKPDENKPDENKPDDTDDTDDVFLPRPQMNFSNKVSKQDEDDDHFLSRPQLFKK